MFSVKSAYHMAGSAQPVMAIVFSGKKKIWTVKASNASKKFIWRACQNVLPTKQNLLRKGVVENDLCPCCHSEVESVIHALWECPGAQDVWGCGPILFQKCLFFGRYDRTCLLFIYQTK
jgi:hypothetical protein